MPATIDIGTALWVAGSVAGVVFLLVLVAPLVESWRLDRRARRRGGYLR